MMDVSQTYGKWRGILCELGVPENFLSPKQGPCPMCGGKTRYRFDDKEGKGTWICNGCGAGDGFKLLEKMFHWDFKTSIENIKKIIGGVERKEPRRMQTDEQSKESLRALYKQSEPVVFADFVDKYLTSRGLEIRSDALRKINSCRSSRGQMFPAMLAIMSDVEGKPCTMHRTYIKNGKKAEIESPRELMPGKVPEGAAVRLMEPGINLGIAEGIETALAASQIFKIPVWAALNATLLEKWTPPIKSTNIFIFGDNDESYAGQKSAYTLGYKLRMKKISATVFLPKETGTDWNDELLRKTL